MKNYPNSAKTYHDSAVVEAFKEQCRREERKADLIAANSGLVEELQKQNEILRKQLEIARQSDEDAKIDAKKTKICSTITFVVETFISVAALIVSIIALCN